MIVVSFFTSQASFALLMLLFAVTLFNRSFCCHDRDRRLLLIFKQGVEDPSNRLSSWASVQDCCAWNGVECDFNTSRVKSLFLENVRQNIPNSLRGEINLSSLLQLEFLDWLDLSFNDFERISMPSLNTSLVSKLDFLDLSYNIHLHIDDFHWLSRLPSLRNLALSGIHPPLETNWIKSLASLPLENLRLEDCKLTSFIQSVENVSFSSLSFLDLGLNDFTYGLPNWLFNLSKGLAYLHLNQCNLSGPIPDFSGYRNLHTLDLSNNKLRGSIPDWLGQHDHLHHLILSSNLLSSIPSSLRNSTALSVLDLSFNNLSGALPKTLVQSDLFLDLSHNSISGDISNLLLTSAFIYLSFNKFEGQLPCISGSVNILDLSHNSFSGSLSSLLCHHTKIETSSLGYLDISNNFLSEELPDCWNNWPFLSHIYLGSNKLSGEVPPTMGSLHYLLLLDLHSNGFQGEIPSTFQNCTSLLLINLEGNNFSGSIPNWMPQIISVVNLRSNQFTGYIPPQLCSLSNLIVLDLANNKISGSIPSCLYNLTSMVSGLSNLFFMNKMMPGGQPEMDGFPIPIKFKTNLYIKGQKLEYEENLILLGSIDLSANRLFGDVPVQLFQLKMLQFLNVSYNHLTGEIPEQIGEMKDLESLDFSHNSLHGNIPQSMSSLSFLSDLNLSYNNFSGQIPLGTQLQSFDAQSYIGNPKLCGAPLQKNCTRQEKPDDTKQVGGNDDGTFLRSLYLGMGIGFAVGFWVVCGSLFLNKTWRHSYFRFFDGMMDRIYVFVSIKLRRFH